MPKPKAYIPAELVTKAMHRFWTHGYHATSVSDLVQATGVSRHGIYGEHHDKRGLFLAAIEAYFQTIVTPAFTPVESTTAGFKEIRAYFTHQIRLAAQHGLPGPGCLMVNTMVEGAPHDDRFRQEVLNHLARLKAGFRRALANERRRLQPQHPIHLNQLADFLTISAQGLWAVSRVTSNAKALHNYADQLLSPIESSFQS